MPKFAQFQQQQAYARRVRQHSQESDPIFISLRLCMLLIAILGFITGDPERLHYGYDFNGRVCGTGAMKDRPFVFYPFPYPNDLTSTSLDGADFTWATCVKSCPNQRPPAIPNRLLALDCACTHAMHEVVILKNEVIQRLMTVDSRIVARRVHPRQEAEQSSQKTIQRSSTRNGNAHSHLYTTAACRCSRCPQRKATDPVLFQ